MVSTSRWKQLPDSNIAFAFDIGCLWNHLLDYFGSEYDKQNIILMIFWNVFMNIFDFKQSCDWVNGIFVDYFDMNWATNELEMIYYLLLNKSDKLNFITMFLNAQVLLCKTFEVMMYEMYFMKNRATRKLIKNVVFLNYFFWKWLFNEEVSLYQFCRYLVRTKCLQPHYLWLAT